MKALFAWIVGLAILAGASATQAQCVIEPGVYAGVANQISQVKKPGVVEATWRFSTAIELTTNCEGKATVKYSNTSIRLLVGAMLPPPVVGNCDLTVADGTAEAIVEKGEGNLPRIIFPMLQAVTFHACEGLALMWYDFLDFAKFYGPGAAPQAYEFQATQREEPPLTYRGTKPFVSHPALAALADRVKEWGGTWTIEYLWVLTRAPAGQGPPPQTDEAKTPVVSPITGRFERIFLAGVGPVPNVYSVNVDWGGEAPGTITFRLDGAVIPSTPTATGASANIQVDTLPVGTRNLSVVAVSTKGKQAFAQRPIRIVEVPIWAQEFNLAVLTPLQPPFVNYRGQKSITLGAALRNVSSDDPVLGGSWGLQQSSVTLLLTLSSAGGIGQAPITPPLTFRLGPNSIVPNFTSAAVLRVNLTETALLLVSGTLAFQGRTFGVSREFKGVFPGFQHRADKAFFAETTVITFTINASAAGSINLGLVDDRIKVTDGQVTLKGVLSALHESHPSGDNLFVTATGEGSLIIQFDPDAVPTTCLFSSNYLGRYEIFESPGLGLPLTITDVRTQPRAFSSCN